MTETETETTTAPTTEKKSIINPKYLDKYRNTPKDWLSTFVDGIVKKAPMKQKTTKNEDGEDVVTMVAGKPALDLDALFSLCKANGIDTASMEEQRDRKNAPGRIRMTLGNRLRAEALKRHGLMNIEGEFVEASAEFIGDTPKTKNPDGSKIVVAKQEASAEPETADA